MKCVSIITTCHSEETDMQIITQERIIISKIPRKDWMRLINLIPDIEKARVFRRVIPEQTTPDGLSTFPQEVNEKIVNNFELTCYDIGIILKFDWMKWEEGIQILNTKGFDFSSLDVETLCKFITMLVRADRFAFNGILAINFKNGVILKILYALKNKLGYE